MFLKKDHKWSDVENEILVNHRPVYMRGKRNLTQGHAWVCEGVRSIDHTIYYFVEYRIGSEGNYSYSTLDGPTASSPKSSDGYIQAYCYLNWGWGGIGNAWYGFDDVNSPNGNYNRDRMNLYVSPK